MFTRRAKHPALRVKCIALLGYVLGVFVGAVLEMELDSKTQQTFIQA